MNLKDAKIDIAIFFYSLPPLKILALGSLVPLIFIGAGKISRLA